MAIASAITVISCAATGMVTPRPVASGGSMPPATMTPVPMTKLPNAMTGMAQRIGVTIAPTRCRRAGVAAGPGARPGQPAGRLGARRGRVAGWDGGEEAGGTGEVLARDGVGGPVVRAGAHEGQAEGDVDALVDAAVLDRNEALVVVHRDHRIEAREAARLHEHGVRRV